MNSPQCLLSVVGADVAGLPFYLVSDIDMVLAFVRGCVLLAVVKQLASLPPTGEKEHLPCI